MTTVIENTSVDTALNIDELTTGSLTGTGVFDVLLQTLRLHLDREFTSGRITGTAYATVYSQALTTFLQQATGYCLSKTKLALELQQLTEQVKLIQMQQDQVLAETDKLAVEAIVASKQGKVLDAQHCEVVARTNQVNAETSTKLPEEVELLKRNQLGVTAQTALATYELTDVKPVEVDNLVRVGLATTATTDHTVQITANAVIEGTNLTKQGNLLDSQKTVSDNQALSVAAGTTETEYRVSDLMPAQLAATTAQTAQVTYTNTYLLPAQLANTAAQTNSSEAQAQLYGQKILSERAQTEDTADAGSVIAIQNALMLKQTENYQRDAEQKAAKIMIETWAVRQNTDGGQPVATNHLDDTFIATAVDALLAGI